MSTRFSKKKKKNSLQAKAKESDFLISYFPQQVKIVQTYSKTALDPLLHSQDETFIEGY